MSTKIEKVGRRKLKNKGEREERERGIYSIQRDQCTIAIISL